MYAGGEAGRLGYLYIIITTIIYIIVMIYRFRINEKNSS